MIVCSCVALLGQVSDKKPKGVIKFTDEATFSVVNSSHRSSKRHSTKREGRTNSMSRRLSFIDKSMNPVMSECVPDALCNGDAVEFCVSVGQLGLSCLAVLGCSQSSLRLDCEFHIVTFAGRRL